MPSAEADDLIHVLWINVGLTRDAGPVARTAATRLSVDEIEPVTGGGSRP